MTETSEKRALFVMIGQRDIPTGGYVFNRKMARALEDAGAYVRVLHASTLPERLRGSAFRTSLHVLKVCRELDPHLVVVSKSYRYVIPLMSYLRFRSVPVLYLVHHLEWHDRGSEGSMARRSMVRWLLKRASAIWANSRSTMRDLELLGVEPGKVTVVPPGLDREGAEPPDRKGRKGPVRILCPGTVCPRKAQLDLVRACARLEGREWRLVIAGSMEACPEYAAAVLDLIDSLDLAGRVQTTGNLEREEIRRQYEVADILVQPSLWEGFGMSVAEGMWFGLPIVATDAGALPELVSDGHNGLLLPPGDVEVLAETIGLLLDSPERRWRLGRNARAAAEGLCSWEETSERFCRLAFETAGWERFE